MRRGPVGHWCGYVGLPEGHRFHGVEYSAPVKAPDGWLDRPAKIDEDYGAIALFCASVNSNPAEGIYPLELLVRCHGGLTYSKKDLLSRKADDLWWLGFDSAHADDMCPKSSYDTGGTYRDEQYVRASLAKLCGDIAGLDAALSRPA